MQVVVQDEIQQRPDLQSAVVAATDLLKEELGGSASRIQAHWSLSRDDRDRTLLELKVADWTGSVSYRFAAEEMSSRSHMKVRLHRLWGDLLQVRSHVQLDEMLWDLQQLGVE